MIINKILVPIRKWFSTPVGFYILVTLLLFIIVLGVDFIFYSDWSGEDTRSLWVNIHASIIEVFLLGSFIFWFNKLNQKKERISRWLEEMEDYRTWDEKEATYRLIGLMKRLNKENISDFDLAFAFLQGGELVAMHMQRADLSMANLQHANLPLALLEGANLFGANLHKANLNLAFLEGANLSEAILEEAYLYGTTLKGANLENANLEGVYVDDPAWIQKLISWKCKGVDDIVENYFVSCEIAEENEVYRVRKKEKLVNSHVEE